MVPVHGVQVHARPALSFYVLLIAFLGFCWNVEMTSLIQVHLLALMAAGSPAESNSMLPSIKRRA
jgi:hypothetical protein